MLVHLQDAGRAESNQTKMTRKLTLDEEATCNISLRKKKTQINRTFLG